MTVTMPHNLKIGWSELAIQRHTKPEATTYWQWPHELLVNLVKKHWTDRVPGVGRTDLDKVIVVPMNETEEDLQALFTCNWINIKNLDWYQNIKGEVVTRQVGEDPYIQLRVPAAPPESTKEKGKTEPVRFAKVVLYSKEALLENDGKRSGDFDWEIVAVLAGPWEKEPMMPLTMARNFLNKTGGTFAPYTAEQFAESIYFWSQYIQVQR